MPRRSRWILPVIALIGAVWLGHPRAQVASSVIVGTGGTTFYGIGDLAGGGTNSIVQEATQVGSTVHAVGASTRTATQTPIAALDTAVVWDSASDTFTPIPDLVAFGTAPTSMASAAFAITPDAQFVAGRLRNLASNQNFSLGVQVPRSSVNTPTSISAFMALDLSDNGNIVVGQQFLDNAPPNGSVNNFRAFWVDISTNTPVQVPLLVSNHPTVGCFVAGTAVTAPPRTCLDSIPAFRGLSSGGSVMVGTAYKGTFSGIINTALNQYQTTNGLAFRWVFNQPAVTEIPRPAGSTWSSAIAISPDGNLTLAGGNSSDYPLGEVWIHNATTDTIQELGSPNTAITPRLLGGMTEDGSVVGVTFGGSPLQNAGFSNNPVQYAYLRNSHNWFHLANVLAAQGIDLWANGWDPTNMLLTGIRSVDSDNNGTPDVELVFGQGRRRNANGSAGAPEGFVVSFPVGVLSSYQLPDAVSVENRALVGAWALGADPNNPRSVAVFLADGTFYTTTSASALVALGFPPSGARFERGVYTLSAGNAFTLTTTEDRDGAGPPQSGTTPSTFVFNGLTSSLNGRQSLSVNFTSADTVTVEDASCSPVCSVFQATRIAGGAGSIVGGWHADFDQPDFTARVVIVFLDSVADFKYFTLIDSEGNETDSETGTYTWDADLHELVLTRDVGGSPDSNEATLTQDQLGLIVVGDEGNVFPLERIVNPSTVLPSITNATLEASGTEDAAFSYTVTAVNALSFSAEGLPAGLTIDPNTGVISGASAVNGTFNVTITVTNTFGDTDTATLVLTFAPASFHGIGDLSGGNVASIVMDATRVNGTIYAVGASSKGANTTGTNTDSPALWTWDGVIGQLTPLPEQVVFPTHPTNSRWAYDITPNAEFIGSRVRNDVNNQNTSSAVRVARNGSNLTNFILPGPAPVGFATAALSDNGSIAYAHAASTISSNNSIVRYDLQTGTKSNVPLLSGFTQLIPTIGGASSDGSVMVGTGVNALWTGSNGRAFRYDHTASTTTAIPLLAGGTWNFPIAISPDGNLTVVAGNSDAVANGELYLHDAAAGTTTPLGSPNTAWGPRQFGGMTADGSVVAVTYTSGAWGPSAQEATPVQSRYAYLRNEHGWFPLASAVAAQGIDLGAQSWVPNSMLVTGISTAGGVDLVFGQGSRRVNPTSGTTFQEGFVAEFPAGFLADFNPQPTPPQGTAIVGGWVAEVLRTISGTTELDVDVNVYMTDGTYVHVQATPQPVTNTAAAVGFERGLYSWRSDTERLTVTPRYDTNGAAGLGNFVESPGLTFSPASGNLTGDVVLPSTSVRISGGVPVGAWVRGNPAGADSLEMLIFRADGIYYHARDGNANEAPTSVDGVETGTYAWDSQNNTLTRTETTVDRNGNWGLSGVAGPAAATISADGLQLVLTAGAPGTYTRVIDPSTVVPVINDFNATAEVGTPLSLPVPAINTLTFGASGLPAGLSIDSSTGVISGTPTVGGSFSVALTATNTFGDVDQATLTLTIAIPTPVGQNVVVAPEVPEGLGPVTLSFGEITTAGTTTVTVVDPADAPPIPVPGSVSVAGIIYEVETTAVYQGLITLCFSYAGVDFGTDTPRLFHYENNQWVDITTSVDPATETICGATTSLSPFAVFASSVVRTGFYAPVNPIAGFLNIAKGGSTVPLKFEVHVNGVEQTSTNGLQLTIQPIVCDTSAPLDEVEAAATTGDTTLRYDADAGYFIQNWKVPRTPGVCYMVRMTTAADGLALTSRFQVK